MTRIESNDPRAQRTRRALTTAIKELLTQKQPHKITVQEITERAGVARHTFYNHFDTKDDLLNLLVDSVLDRFFSELGSWEIFDMDPDLELALFTGFFEAWKDDREITQLLQIPEMEALMIERLKAFFTRLYYHKIKRELPGVSMHFANYVISFNAYSLVGILLAWLEGGMRDSPRHLGGFLQMLTGSQQRLKAVREYQELLGGGKSLPG